jgi:hypothetical protein
MKKPIRKHLLSFLVFFVALVIIFQEWVWNTVKPWLEFFSRFKIIQRLEFWVAGLGAYTALLLFLVPATITQLAEFWGIGLSAQGKVILGPAVYIFAKVFGFMLLSRIFTLTRPKLMTVKWFAKTYNWFMAAKDWVYIKLEEIGVWQKIKAIKILAKQKYHTVLDEYFPERRNIFAKIFRRVKVKLNEND